MMGLRRDTRAHLQPIHTQAVESTITYKPRGLPWWLRWLRICLQCRRLGFDPWVRKIPWCIKQLQVYNFIWMSHDSSQIHIVTP